MIIKNCTPVNNIQKLNLSLSRKVKQFIRTCKDYPHKSSALVMIHSVSSELYAETLLRLIEAVGARSYFSGTVSFPFGGVGCRLTVSVIVYRECRSLPEGAREVVTDLVPVWWEFHTTVDGEERINDFSFGCLRTLLR